VTASSVLLTVGQHIMRVSVDSGGWNFNYADISVGSPPQGLEHAGIDLHA
jgi:hypothetical protein